MAPTTFRTSAFALAVGFALAGCRTSPFHEMSQQRLREAVIDATERELRDALLQPARITTTREDLVARLGIRPDFMPELQRMAGPDSYDPHTLALGEDLLGQPARAVEVSLARALRTATEHNLAVQFARLGPAVSEAQVQAAEAAFDWTLFASGTWNTTNNPQTSTTFSSVTSTNVETIATSVGLRRSLVGGGRLTTQWDNNYTDNNTPGLSVVPNPSVSSAFLIQWDQPLLRGAGSEITQAEIRVARNAERNAVQTLRRDLMRVLSDTEKTYWDLSRAVYDVLITQRLLDRGIEVRRQLEQRLPLDANQAQIASARARVEQRRADLDRARRQVRVLSDRLKQLMNDPQLPVGSEIVILPADRPVDQPIRFSLAESLRQAVAYRPEVQQAAIAIDDASVRLTVARNARLPDLSLRLQVRWSSLDKDLGTTTTHLFQGTFIDYLAGLTFEQPIGNRRANADARRRLLERSQTVIAYRNAVQTVAGDVKAALNRVILNYSLIAQTASARVAAAEILRVLQVEKDFRQGFTVERLDLELNRQEALAAAERDEIQALVEYNQSLADLFQAMGTTLERNNIVLRVPWSDDAWEEWRHLRAE
jgi:outer membrane protein